MTWGRMIAVTAVCAVVATGCGGSSDGTSETTPATGGDPVTAPVTAVPSVPDIGVPTVTGPTVTSGEDVDEVRRVMREYVDAFVAADGETACGLLTDESAAAFLDAVGAVVGASTCAEAFAAASGQLPEEQRDAFRGAVIDGLAVTGDTARGRLSVTGVSNDFRLVRIQGEWRIANLPGQ